MGSFSALYLRMRVGGKKENFPACGVAAYFLKPFSHIEFSIFLYLRTNFFYFYNLLLFEKHAAAPQTLQGLGLRPPQNFRKTRRKTLSYVQLC